MQGLTVESNDMETYPPGVRFLPSDIEVLHYYLKNKLEKKPLPPANIRDVDIYKFNPEDLAGIYKPTCDKPEEWYFFTPRDRKYRNGKRPNRKAGDGFWRATGADKEVKMKGKVIGWKKALVFYFGKPPNGQKTSWIMHEYTLRDAPSSSTIGSDDMMLDVFVLCKIHKHTRKSDTEREQDTFRNESLYKSHNQSSENCFLEQQQPNLMAESSSNYAQVQAPPVLIPEFPGQYEYVPEFFGEHEEDMLLLDFPKDSLYKSQNQSSTTENSFLEQQQPNLMAESSSNYTQVQAPPVLLPEFPGQFEEEKIHVPKFFGEHEEDMLLLDFPKDLLLPEIFYTP